MIINFANSVSFIGCDIMSCRNQETLNMTKNVKKNCFYERSKTVYLIFVVYSFCDSSCVYRSSIVFVFLLHDYLKFQAHSLFKSSLLCRRHAIAVSVGGSVSPSVYPSVTLFLILRDFAVLRSVEGHQVQKWEKRAFKILFVYV